jgi:hypothetical protein
MTDAAVIRAVYPSGTMKRLARLMGVPLDTARHWLFRKVSAARRRELALALLRELDEQDRNERAAARAQLRAMVGTDGVDCVLDGAGAGKGGGASSGPPAGAMGGTIEH